MHTTNYVNNFIEVAEDCPATGAEIPGPRAGKETVASLQYKMLADAPYQFTSDDVLFGVYADRNDIPEADRLAARKDFFNKGQPCFRASPLTKRYGWGVHSDADGRIALFAMDSDEYVALVADDALEHVRAMRSRKA